MYIELKGKRALFARHELKIEQYSYDVPTPSALLGILKSIYWKPEMAYNIKRIFVINKPQFELIMTNAQSKAQDGGNLEKALINGEGVSVNRRDNATPRTMNVLTDVHYVVDFDIVLTEKGTCKDDTVKKHSTIFQRRVEKGQYFRLPCLGISEFPCDYNLIDKQDIPESKIKGVHELGVMLHHIDYKGEMPKPVFYKPVMRDGIINVSESSDSDKGWLFAELCRFYDRNYAKYDFPTLGYSAEKVTYKATLSKDGRMIQFAPLCIDTKGKIKPVMITVPEMVKGRTSGIKANFLYDNAGYVFGFDDKRGYEKKCAFIQKIEDVVKEPTEETEILLKFLKSFRYDDYAALIEPYGELVGNIVFQIEVSDFFIHDVDSIKKQWKNFYESTLPDIMGTCSVTGKYEKVVDMHPIIKGVINSSSFTKLISVNTSNTAFNSYGWQGLENSAMGVDAAFKYSASLNWLLQQINHRVSVGNSTFVFWTENDNEILTDTIKNILLGCETDNETVDFSVLNEQERFYIVELRANASRLFVNGFWSIDNIDDLFDFSKKKLYKKGDIPQYWDYILDKKKGMSSLNKDCAAYKLGELLAILEKAQKDAVKSTRESITIADKYLEKASLMPSTVFPRLLQMSIHHTNKVDYGTSNKITQKLNELEVFDNPFPKRLSEEERCLFFMGYYQQRDSLKYKKENNEIKENE